MGELLERLNIFAAVGRVFLAFLAATGRLALFTADAISHCVRPPIYWLLMLQQMVRIGYFSLPVVGLDGVLHRRRAVPADLSSAATATARKPSCRRSWCSASRASLGPVIAGLMVAGRVAAAIAAEIGTMRVTEQIDALTTLSTNPIKYLVAPRLIAAVVTMPILVAVADSIGVFGGYVVGTTQARLQRRGLSARTRHDFVTCGRCRFGPHQGRRVRLHHRADGLLSTASIPRAARRASGRRRPMRWCRRRS